MFPLSHHTPSDTFDAMFRASADLPTLDTMVTPSFVGIHATALLLAERHITLATPRLIVLGDDGFSFTPLSSCVDRASPHIVKTFATMMEADLTIPEHLFGMEWSSSSPEFGFDMRDFFLFNDLCAFSDTIHDHDPDEPELVLDRSRLFVTRFQSGHDVMARQAHVDKVQNHLISLVPGLV